MDIGGIVAPTDSPKASMLPMGEDRSATPEREEKRRASERARARTWKERGRWEIEREDVRERTSPGLRVLAEARRTRSNGRPQESRT